MSDSVKTNSVDKPIAGVTKDELEKSFREFEKRLEETHLALFQQRPPRSESSIVSLIKVK